MTDAVEPTQSLDLAEKKTNWGTIGIWIGVILIIAVLGWGLIKVQQDPPDTTAPNFEMQFFDGYEWQDSQAASLSDFAGQPVIINFWASWCAECRIEADLLEQTWRDYKDLGVVFLGIAYVDVEPRSLEYLEEYNITYPNAPDLRTLISEEYGLTGVPETFFVGKDGQIVHHQIGPISETMLNGLVTEMLSAEG